MQNSVSRRKFLQTSLSGSLYLLMAPSLVDGTTFTSSTENLGGITPVSIIDNACMLAYRSGMLSLPSQKVVITDIHLRDTPGNKGRLAMILPSFDIRLIDMIKKLKANNDIKHPQEKRAIVFGWAAVNAVHRHINPFMQGKNVHDAIRTRMHQDALVIDGFSAPEHDVTKAFADDVENLFNSMLVRTITRTHTLKPDADDGIGWVNRMADWQRKNKNYMHEFAQIMVSPDHQVAGAGFFNRKDKIIEAARLLQHSRDVSPETILNEINNMKGSAYGKALAEATRGILAIDSYLQGKVTDDKLIEQLNLSS